MPLCNKPAIFERMIDTLRGLSWTTCLCYLDDIVTFLSFFNDNLDCLSQVLSCFSEAWLQLNAKKFFFSHLPILGICVDSTEIRSDIDQIKDIPNIPRPQYTRHLQIFLGYVISSGD